MNKNSDEIQSQKQNVLVNCEEDLARMTNRKALITHVKAKRSSKKNSTNRETEDFYYNYAKPKDKTKLATSTTRGTHRNTWKRRLGISRSNKTIEFA